MPTRDFSTKEYNNNTDGEKQINFNDDDDGDQNVMQSNELMLSKRGGSPDGKAGELNLTDANLMKKSKGDDDEEEDKQSDRKKGSAEKKKGGGGDGPIKYKPKEDMPSIEFYWVNRKPTSYGWMGKVLLDVQARDPDRNILKTYMFFTSPQAKYDMRSFFLWTGMDILSKNGVKVPGLEHFNVMNWGKPDWDQVFKRKIATVQKGNVGVFFCGNQYLDKEIHELCIKYSGEVKFRYCKEIFG